MEYIIKFLSILIIWSIIYYYINNNIQLKTIYNNSVTEGFDTTYYPDTTDTTTNPVTSVTTSSTKNGNCMWPPWGSTKQSCKDRCNVWSLTNTDYTCSREECNTLCDNCSNKETCEWLGTIDKEPKDEILTIPSIVQCIPGNSKIIVQIVYDIKYFWEGSVLNLETTPDMLIVQYFKTRNPSEGIKIKKIKFVKDKMYTILINNLDNDNEYSISYYPIINNEKYSSKMSGIVTSTPNSNIEIYPKSLKFDN
mgnify:CR=1 FL=1